MSGRAFVTTVYRMVYRAEKMRIIITGAGLLGAHAAAALLDGGHEVTLFDVAPNAAYVRGVVGRRPVRIVTGDVADAAAIAAAAAGHDAVVHTAGLIGPKAQEDPGRALAVNVIGTLNAAAAAREGGATRFVYASTHGVYDFAAKVAGPMTEAWPTDARAVYPATKLAAERLLRALADAYGISVIVLRFVNLFGRGTYAAGSRGGEAFDELVTSAVRGEVGHIRSPLAGRSEWLYAKDAARAVALATAARVSERFTLVNIGSGRLTGPEDVTAAIGAAVPNAAFAAAGPPGRERAQAFDLTRARSVLGWAPEYTLETAVADYVRDAQSGHTAGSE